MAARTSLGAPPACHRPGSRPRVVTGPSLLLADEPTGNLDSGTGEEIMRLFRELNEQGNAIIIVTHEADIAAHARRIIRIRDGRVSEDRPNDSSRAERVAQAKGDAPEGAVQAGQDGKGEADLWFLAGLFLKFPAHHQVKQLLAASKFHIRPDFNTILPLHQWIKTLV